MDGHEDIQVTELGLVEDARGDSDIRADGGGLEAEELAGVRDGMGRIGKSERDLPVERGHVALPGLAVNEGDPGVRGAGLERGNVGGVADGGSWKEWVSRGGRSEKEAY